MTVFASKDAFLGLGIEKVNPSASLTTQDCTICNKPLAVNHNHFSPQSELRGYHTAARVAACGHMHGKDCIEAWLDVGNCCPTCNRPLFEMTGDPITQRDVNSVIHTLGPMYGEGRVTVAVVAAMQKQEREQAALRRYHEQEVAMQKKKDAKAQDDGFMLDGGDFLDSDEELDFGQDMDGEDHFEVEGDEDEASWETETNEGEDERVEK
ncbi:hypothetical protein ACEQ8H_003178 [Pleosporales sp. CAS-2024a]